MNTEKKIGIWLDSRHADLFWFENSEIMHQKIVSNVPEGKVKGGSRSKSIWGPMNKVSESKVLNRKVTARRRYYQELGENIKGFNEVFLWGPGAAKEELSIFLEDECPDCPKVQAVRTTDSMTMNQKKALVRNAFA